MAKKHAKPAGLPDEGRRRVIIEGVRPEVDGGAFAIKRTAGGTVIVEADAFTDGHDAIFCVLQYRREDDTRWRETPMRALVNDRWRGEFTVETLGRYVYTVSAWVDHFLSWRRDLGKRIEANQDDALVYQIGANLIQAAAARAKGEDAKSLGQFAQQLQQENEVLRRRAIALDAGLNALMVRHADRRFICTYEKTLPVVVDRERARFSSWYEFFPRSCTDDGVRHATFKDCEARLKYAAAMGFDIVYLPPIHPIGTTYRKGKNNALKSGPDDVGSPWAIGAAEGGHKDVLAKLGTLADFRSFVSRASELGLEVALDIAYQCSPDHPYVKAHPDWFRQRPDGTVQYAENPPKKYQDIYPFDFESDDWWGLWRELKSVFDFWIEAGVKIFRVDNPHTKTFGFWAWAIDELKRDHPELIFLSEAFTRPKVMHRLAKLGFTQSYTYFTWRNTKAELVEYFTELSKDPSREYFRPNVWPNTPDILHEYLQFGGRPAFMARAVLASTLSANYGIYGPAFELCENKPREPGSEEYFNSEKYQLRQWDIDRSDSLRDLLTRLNQARRKNPALQSDWRLHFHAVDNEQLICYSKSTGDFSNIILVVVNLDSTYKHSGWVDLSLAELGLNAQEPFQVHDLLTEARYIWQGARNYVELDPHGLPAHVFHVQRHVGREQDFDHFR